MTYFLTIDGVDYEISDFRISGDIDSWGYTWSASLLHYRDYVTLNPKSSYKVAYFHCVLDGYTGGAFSHDLGTFKLLVESAERSRNESDISFSIIGRSFNALLDSRYNAKINRVYENISAYTIVNDLCSAAGITLTWTIDDWIIRYYEANGVYPVDIIRAITESVAIMQPTIDGGLLICKRDKQKPTELTAPDFTFNDNDIISLSESYIDRGGFDFVSVGNEDIGVNNPNARMEWDGKNRKLKIYIVPWQSVSLHHSQPDDNLTLHYDGVVIEPVLNEEVTFSDGKASLSKPFYSNLSVDWIENELGTVTALESGELICDTIGQGLANVTYNTRYHKYAASPNNGIERALVWAE